MRTDTSPDHPARHRAITIGERHGRRVCRTGASLADRIRMVRHGNGGGRQHSLQRRRRAAARQSAAIVEAEVERIEGALRLFRAESELRRLNRDGTLPEPSADLQRAVTLRFAPPTSRRDFDSSVQALWEAHVDWFADGTRTTLPPGAMIARTREEWTGGRSSLRRRRSRSARAGPWRSTASARATSPIAPRSFWRDKALHASSSTSASSGRSRCARGVAVELVSRDNAEPLRLALGALAASEGSAKNKVGPRAQRPRRPQVGLGRGAAAIRMRTRTRASPGTSPTSSTTSRNPRPRYPTPRWRSPASRTRRKPRISGPTSSNATRRGDCDCDQTRFISSRRKMVCSGVRDSSRTEPLAARPAPDTASWASGGSAR